MGAQARPSGGEGLADGLRALRLTVLAFLLLDVVTSLLGPALGVPDLGPTGAAAALQMAVVTAAAVATMWRHPRTAVALSVLVVALILPLDPSGQEAWLVAITAVTAAVRAQPPQVVAVALAQVAWAVVFGVNAESLHPGWGREAGLAMLALSGASFAAGLVARWFLRARDRRRRQVRERERDNRQIRTQERARLADDLQVVLTQGLATIEDEIDTVTRRPSDAAGLRQRLGRIDQQSRDLLTELRDLLDVLRRDPEPTAVPAATPVGPTRRGLDLLTARHVRIAAATVFGLLGVRAGVSSAHLPSGVATWVTAIGLSACAFAVWRAGVGAALAALALAVALLQGATDFWDALAVALLCLVGTQRVPVRRVWGLALALVGYGGVVAWTDRVDPVGHLILIGYVGALSLAVGLTVRHVVEARAESLRRLVDLTREREQVEGEERAAVARELHDVVAHQLSSTTMLVLATSASEDAATLTDTLGRVRRCTEAAQHELVTLLYAMRRPETDQLRPSPLVTPRSSASALAERLRDNGFDPVLQVDATADLLDPTTQRTLARIMQEATTNILRYTPRGSRCSFVLTVADVVTLTISSPLSPTVRTSRLSLGWGLRGIRERVDLSRGTFSAGPERGLWVVAVELPAVARAAAEPDHVDVVPRT